LNPRSTGQRGSTLAHVEYGYVTFNVRSGSFATGTACARDWQMSATPSKADLSCVGVRAPGTTNQDLAGLALTPLQ
jgi:hypothetical protein